MSEYKVVDDFQVKDVRVLSLDRPCGEDVYTKDMYIEGKKYKHLPNSIQQWVLLPGEHESFVGQTVVFA